MIRTYTFAMVAALMLLSLAACYSDEDRDDRDRHQDRQIYGDQQPHDAPQYSNPDYNNPNRDETWHPDDYDRR